MGFQHIIHVKSCLLAEEFLLCWSFHEIILGGYSGRTSHGKVRRSFPNFRCATDGFCSCFLEVLSYRFLQFFQILCGLEGLSYFFFHLCKSYCLVQGDSVISCSFPVQFHLYLADLYFC